MTSAGSSDRIAAGRFNQNAKETGLAHEPDL
jgi:hypothetical protein